MMRISARRIETRPPKNGRQKGRHRAGFSLLEILVCLLLLGILSVGFARVFQGSLAIGQLQAKESAHIRERRRAVRHQFAELGDAEAVISIVEETPDT